MTGYGSASHPIEMGEGSYVNLQVEIRAVNSRFLDLSFRIPDECKSAEGALRELLNKHLKRARLRFGLLGVKAQASMGTPKVQLQ